MASVVASQAAAMRMQSTLLDRHKREDRKWRVCTHRRE